MSKASSAVLKFSVSLRCFMSLCAGICSFCDQDQLRALGMGSAGLRTCSMFCHVFYFLSWCTGSHSHVDSNTDPSNRPARVLLLLAALRSPNKFDVDIYVPADKKSVPKGPYLLQPHFQVEQNAPQAICLQQTHTAYSEQNVSP